MAEHKNFLIYKDWYYFVEHLSDEDAGKLFKGLFRFAINGEVDDHGDSPITPVYNFMIKHIAENEKKYQELCKINSRNGQKGGRPKKYDTSYDNENPPLTIACEDDRGAANKSKTNRSQAKKADNDNENEKENKNVNEKENVPAGTFKKPNGLKEAEMFNMMIGFEELRKKHTNR